MIETIPLLPEIPDQLKLAAQSGRLVPFIGAGVSRLAKCPSWEEFADGLLEQLVARGALDHRQVKQIQDQHLPPRLKLSFVRNIAGQKGVILDYEEIIHARKDMTNPVGRRLYRALGRLAKTFVTTNYDYWLDSELAAESTGSAAGGADPASSSRDADRPNIIYKRADITFDRLMIPGTVIHLHGSLRSPDEMIVTTGDYLNFYRNVPSIKPADENPILPFLRTLFHERVILFVGYGLADLEILEYVVLKSRMPSETKHYILQPFFSHELEIANLYDRYYANDCGMVMLPFLRDQRNHLQLIEVAEHLAGIMPGRDLMAAERQAQMEAMLDVT